MWAIKINDTEYTFKIANKLIESNLLCPISSQLSHQKNGQDLLYSSPLAHLYFSPKSLWLFVSRQFLLQVLLAKVLVRLANFST